MKPKTTVLLAAVSLTSLIAFSQTPANDSKRGECYEIFWRDEEHPELEGLPRLQPDAELLEERH